MPIISLYWKVCEIEQAYTPNQDYFYEGCCYVICYLYTVYLTDLIMFCYYVSWLQNVLD